MLFFNVESDYCKSNYRLYYIYDSQQKLKNYLFYSTKIC